jgi:hypothetical protein
MNAAVRHSTIFRITSTDNDGFRPAFAPDEDASCFEEAYRTFIYNDEVALFADLTHFNRMAFLFDGLDVPGYDPKDNDPSAEDLVRHGTVLEDGAILFNDGVKLEADAIWGSFGLSVPSFSRGFGF